MYRCNLMLFAAGLGTRLRPYTETYPKPTIPLLGIPMGYYLLPYFKSLFVSRFIVNTFHRPERVHQLYSVLNTNAQFSDEKEFIKGSGGGLKQAESLFSEDTENILVCNSDEVLFTPETDFLEMALKKHEQKNALATLIVIQHPLAGKQFGAIWCNDQGKVIHIGKEVPSEPATPWHFVGIQIVSKRLLEHIPLGLESNIFYDVMIHFLKKDLVQIYSIKADWYETGNINDYTEAKKQILEKLKTEHYYQKHFEDLGKLPRSQISDLA